MVLCLANPPAGSGGLAGERSRRVPGKNPLLGERIQVREGVPLNCLAASPCLHRSIKAKTPAIVLNQGKSRQTLKKLNATITSANGAAPYQPRATLWVRTPNDPSPEGATHPANQASIKAENPSNRA